MDTECPDTTFVVLPDVVTHLTSTVLVVKGTDVAADTAAAADPAADAAGSDSASACTFEYALDELGVVAGGGGESSGGDAASGTGSGGSTSAGGGSGGSSSSSSSSTSSEEETGAWQQGDSSGVIHLHQLKVSCCGDVVVGDGGGGDGAQCCVFGISSIVHTET